jgi:integrase
MSRKRRGHHEGGVYQRKSDGRWVGSVTVGRTPEGKQKRRVVYGDTKKEVLDKLKDLYASAAGVLAEPTKMTVSDFLGRWRETVGRTKRTSTQKRRENYIDKHILPYLGGVRLAKLELVHLEVWLAELERDGRSAWTRHQAATVLGTALRKAVRQKLIAFNPVAELAKPPLPDKKIQILTEAQSRALLAASTSHRLHAVFVLALASGMRIGELLALHWGDMSFEARTVTVNHTLQDRAGGGFSLEPPKSKASKRTIDLPEFAITALNEHRKRMLAEGRDVRAGAVFVTTAGTYYSRSNFARQVFKAILEKVNTDMKASHKEDDPTPDLLPDITFHALRHTHASTLLARGRNIREISERLGHAKPEMTLRIYAHLMPGTGKETARVLDQVFAV